MTTDALLNLAIELRGLATRWESMDAADRELVWTHLAANLAARQRAWVTLPQSAAATAATTDDQGTRDEAVGA